MAKQKVVPGPGWWKSVDLLQTNVVGFKLERWEGSLMHIRGE